MWVKLLNNMVASVRHALNLNKAQTNKIRFKKINKTIV